LIGAAGYNLKPLNLVAYLNRMNVFMDVSHMFQICIDASIPFVVYVHTIFTNRSFVVYVPVRRYEPLNWLVGLVVDEGDCLTLDACERRKLGHTSNTWHISGCQLRGYKRIGTDKINTYTHAVQ
jgi:hypothetical protein